MRTIYGKGPVRDFPTPSLLRITQSSRLLGGFERLVHSFDDALGGIGRARYSSDTFRTVLLDDCLGQLLLSGIEQHFGFAMLDNLHGSDLATGNNNFHLDLAGVTGAFAGIGAVLVGSGLSTCSQQSGRCSNNQLLDHWL